MANTTIYPFGTGGDLPSSIGVINDCTTGGADKALAAEQGKFLYGYVADAGTANIPFDGGNYYIAKSTGAVSSNNSWIATKYIAVSEGEQFVYSGLPEYASLGVAGYVYDETQDTYTYSRTLIGSTTAALSSKLIIIPSGITHILATSRTSATYSLTKKTSTKLSRISDGLGTIDTNTLIETFTTGGWIKANGEIGTATGAKYALIDVVIGDEIKLYDYTAFGTGSAGEATISKKLTSTTFQPILIKEAGTYDLITYTATESMTIAVSVYRGVRMIVHHSNKPAIWDATTAGLATTREAIASTNTAVEQYDIKLGYMFENIACLGDSMSRGTLGSTTTGLSSFGASWLSFLAKRWGCKSKFHYAKSGTTTYNWLNDNTEYGLGRLLSDTKTFNAYFIAYGHNDSMTTGTASDEAATVTITSGVPSCASGNTFCAYYKAIINQIRTKAPHAIIFCLSEYDNVIKASAKSQAVKDVADWYYTNGDKLVHHIDTGGVPDADMVLGGHYSTVGYAYMARMVDKCVNEVVYQYRGDDEIKYFGSYNTDKTADSPMEGM